MCGFTSTTGLPERRVSINAGYLSSASTDDLRKKERVSACAVQINIGRVAPLSDLVASQQERTQQWEGGIVGWRFDSRELVAAEVQLLKQRLVPLMKQTHQHSAHAGAENAFQRTRLLISDHSESAFPSRLSTRS